MEAASQCHLFLILSFTSSFGGKPERVIGDGGGDVNPLVTDGMIEADTAGVQADAAVGIAAWIAVFQIAANGATDVRQLTAYLMMTAREQLHLKQMVAREAAKQLVAKDSLLGAWALAVGGV